MSNHQFEPEFELPPPRTVPDELRSGPFARGRRNAVLGCLVAGVALLGLSFVPIFARWGQFVLPLAYMDWVGLGLLVLATGMFVYHQVWRGPYRYVTDGLTVAGRVLALELRPSAFHNG